MRRPRSRRLLAAITPILALAVAATSAQAAAGTVHIRGTAYEFNSVHTLLSGATIKVAEYPALSATVASDGTYDLTVPDKAKVTPYIVAAGHHTIYLQTFTTDGADLKHVNFQTPSDGVAAGLTALLGVPHDADGYPTLCAHSPQAAREQGDPSRWVRIVVDGRDGEVVAEAPVIGAVNMDQICVDLSGLERLLAHLPGGGLGAEVELYGSDRGARNFLPTIADRMGIRPYELLCRLNPRIPRVAVEAAGPLARVDQAAMRVAVRAAPDAP